MDSEWGHVLEPVRTWESHYAKASTPLLEVGGNTRGDFLTLKCADREGKLSNFNSYQSLRLLLTLIARVSVQNTCLS